MNSSLQTYKRLPEEAKLALQSGHTEMKSVALYLDECLKEMKERLVTCSIDEIIDLRHEIAGAVKLKRCLDLLIGE